MIYEYAIEPAAAVAWGKCRNDYRYFYDKFGVGTPRIMAEFPKFKNWRRQFKQAMSGAEDLEQQRIMEIFKLLKETLIRRDGYKYDGTIPWLKNAIVEDLRFGFHAIIALENPDNRTKVLTSETAHNHSLLKLEEQDCCPRIAADMAQLISALISNCSEIHFIDQYFGPEEIEYRRPLESFLRKIAIKKGCRPPLSKIVIHTSNKAIKKSFREDCEKKLPGIIPVGMLVTLQRWKEQQGGKSLHGRYILTDVGGVRVEPGIREGNAGEDFEVDLLKRNLYEKLWNDYIEHPAFDPVMAPIDIKGTAERGNP